MSKFGTTDELKRDYDAAARYVSLLKTPQPHFSGSPVGVLHTVNVETQIGHQASPGAQNYWKNRHFDGALARVIARRFEELAAQALDDLRQRVNLSMADEEDELLARLAEIRALKAQNSQETEHASA